MSNISMLRPIKKRELEELERDGAVVLRRLSREVILNGQAAAVYRRLSPRLDSQASVCAAAESAGVSLESAERVVKVLSDAEMFGLGGKARGSELTPGKVFHARHRRYCAHWLRPIYDHPFWDRVTSGRAGPEHILGFAFEKYHYIEGAHEHMALAAAHATPEMMPHLARHFIEEYTHGDIYRRGLAHFYPDHVVVASQPLPSTRALVNFLNESAIRNSFSYYAGNELLQATENDSDAGDSTEIEAFYDALLTHYPWAKPLVKSFIAHTRLDQELGHEDVFLEMCNAIPPLTEAEVDDALQTTKLMAEHLLVFMNGIDRYYVHGAVLPRVSQRLLAQ